ncbi:hypothetical protein UB51_11500 [Paenibacillus sp. IHBB 10380]|nr:hypothetical protein UB51_11500 [Paenibacillus sp. IHBB 10380]
MYFVIVIIIAVGIFMIKEIRKKRIIIIGENNLLIDGLPLDVNEIKSTKINKSYYSLKPIRNAGLNE